MKCEFRRNIDNLYMSRLSLLNHCKLKRRTLVFFGCCNNLCFFIVRCFLFSFTLFNDFKMWTLKKHNLNDSCRLYFCLWKIICTAKQNALNIGCCWNGGKKWCRTLFNNVANSELCESTFQAYLSIWRNIVFT